MSNDNENTPPPAVIAPPAPSEPIDAAPAELPTNSAPTEVTCPTCGTRISKEK